MVQPSIETLGRKRNAPYTHRRYLAAAALGEAGVLCSNPVLIDGSKEYIREGVSLQIHTTTWCRRTSNTMRITPAAVIRLIFGNVTERFEGAPPIKQLFTD
jgi:hypothetical protein